MQKTLHFKSKKGYKKYLAFGHMHHTFGHMHHTARTAEKIVIHGKRHKVKHFSHLYK